MTESLTCIWKRVLNATSIDSRSHFFDLGGDSLAATAMCLEVEQQTGCAIPLGQIFLTPVLEDFAAIISGYDRDNRTPLFVPLKNEGNGCPIFAMTPAMGGIFHFLQQADTLGGDYPFYGIEPRISASGAHNYTSIRDLANHSLAVVRNKQPQGPYRLVGYSFGGTVAWEMARVLEENGEKVDLLVLLDSSNRNGYRISGAGDSLSRKLEQEWKFLCECRRVRRIYSEPFHYTRCIPLAWRKISDSMRAPGGSGKGRNPRNTDGRPGAEEMIVESQQELRDGYDAGKYGGRVHLFRARKQLTLHREIDYDLGWTPCVNPGNLVITTVPGDHFSFMNPPQVEVVASSISSLLRQADEDIQRRINEESDLSGTLESLPMEEPLHGESLTDRFLEVVAAFPRQTAIRDGGTILTYAQLDAVARNIRDFLMDEYPDDPSPVLLHFETGWQFICAIYGVLLAGRCYVPVDPEFPGFRLMEIIRQSGATTLISANPESLPRETASHPAVIAFNTASRHVSRNKTAPPASIPAEAPAVLLFTSGSTGHPKGTVVSRKMLLHIAWRRGSVCGFTPKDRYAIVYTSAFMGAVMAIHTPLLFGSTLSIYNLRKRGLAQLPEWMAAERISILHMITSILRRFLGHWQSVPSLPDLRLLIPGGEKARRSDIDLWKNACDEKVRFATCLGSTECGTIALWPHKMDFAPPAGPIPVGIPFKSLNARILREDGSVAAAGEEGELVVESDYIFRGYLHADELNKSVVQFTPEGRTVYRTGDYGYMDENGVLYNAGRRDSRVKINGNLIELAEVESVMLASGLIDEVAVIHRPIEPGDRESRLVAFFSTRHPGNVETGMVEFLMQRLPRFMIPVRWVRLGAFPETVNGKINRSALQGIELAGQALPDLEQMRP